MKLCEYGCGREAHFQFKNGKWCCSVTTNKCPTVIAKIQEMWKRKREIRRKNHIENLSTSKNGKILCEYGCGREAKYQFKNGKWCCSEHYSLCPIYRKRQSNISIKAWEDPDSGLNSDLYREKRSKIMVESWKDLDSNYNTDSWKEKQSKKMKDSWEDPENVFNSSSFRKEISKRIIEGWKDPHSKYNSIIYRKKLSKLSKRNIEKINKNYPLFSKIEEIRYNPDKPSDKEIQVHCKNHNCKNSKEKDGWFTPYSRQIEQRIAGLNNNTSYFYCSQHCKDTCPLYNLHGDPYKNTELPYTAAEKEVWRQVVLKRENGLCEYCGEPAEHVHHIFPQKLEPFFALDPDYGVACCAKHHYKYAHKDECSTGNLAKIVCSVESQKFLNQTLEFSK